MVQDGGMVDLDSATLNRILDDLKFYEKLLSEQPARLAVGIIVKKNLIDVENCLAVVRKHGRSLNLLIGKGGEVPAIQEVDDSTEGDGGLQESDDEDAEANEDQPKPIRGILDSCEWPEGLADVNFIMATFSFLTKDRSSLLTADFNSCESMFDQCHKCVTRYQKKSEEIDSTATALKSSAENYVTAVMTEKAGVSDNSGMQIAKQVNETLRILIQEINLFATTTSKFKTNLDQMKAKIQEKKDRAKELWANDEAKIHKYFIEESSIAPSVLCWVKADRKTMTRSMLTCTLAKPDDIRMELGDGECIVGHPVTMFSTDGSILQSHQTPITIFIPLQPEDDNNNTETVVMTKTGPNDAYETTKFEVVTKWNRPCMQITRLELSMLIVVPLRRPVVHQEVVDSSGATIIPPTDKTIKMDIPPNAISGKATVSIKTIPEKALPVGLVQNLNSDLMGTSSMVLPKLPKDMMKPANIKMTMESQSEEPDGVLHAMVCKEEGWSSETFERSKTTLGACNIPLTADVKRVVVIKTKESANEEGAKMLAQAIVDSINERTVNFLVMQHGKDQMLLQVHCCKKEYGEKRAKEAEEEGFVMLARQRDVFLLEGAAITMRCSGDIAFNLPRGKTELDMQFSGELIRPATFYIKAATPINAGDYLRGYIEFVVPPKDIGPTEKRLQLHSGDPDVTVSTMPISIKQEAPEKAIGSEAGSSMEYFYRCAESIAHVLTRADLLRLATVFKLKAATIEGLKQNTQSLTIKNVLNIWYLSTKDSLDKFAAFAEALREIGKDGAAATIEKMARERDSEFLEVIRLLTEDSSVLTDAKLFMLDLGLSDADCVELEHKNARSARGFLTDGLLLWRNRLGPGATYELIVRKLKSGGHMRTADLVAKYIPRDV